MRQKRIICLWLIMVLLLGLWGCGGNDSVPPEGPADAGATENPADAGSAEEYDSLEELVADQVPSASGSRNTSTKNKKSKTAYKAPEFADAEFHEDQAEGDENVKIDLSCVSQGYVAVAARSSKRLKFMVTMGDIEPYKYDIDNTGEPSVFPLQCGDGTYKFQVMENISDTKYAQMYSTECTVKLEDEFQPFLRPSDYVNYTKESACVKKAAELSKGAEDALGVVDAVFEYVCDTVKYDSKKAKTVQKGYLPDPDETMRTGKGICFDYAALAASMLRSQGIPTKMVFGYVSPDDLYHAWNMFYTEETGWVMVKYEVKGGDWTRLDLTFSANNTDLEFIGDGSNYADTRYY